MKKNMGSIDRFIRIFIAIVIAIIIITDLFKGLTGVILGIFAGIFLFTGILGFCPLYTIFGFHTLRTKSGPDA
ncbi:MAG: DUF2892 domain-containing protein [Bacteroidota bacterium]